MDNKAQTQDDGVGDYLSEHLPSGVVPYLFTELCQLFSHFLLLLSRNTSIQHYGNNLVPVIRFNVAVG